MTDVSCNKFSMTFILSSWETNLLEKKALILQKIRRQKRSFSEVLKVGGI